MTPSERQTHRNYSAAEGRVLSDEEKAEADLRSRITRQAAFRGEFATAYALLILADEVRALGGSILRGRK